MGRDCLAACETTRIELVCLLLGCACQSLVPRYGVYTKENKAPPVRAKPVHVSAAARGLAPFSSSRRTRMPRAASIASQSCTSRTKGAIELALLLCFALSP